MVVFFCEKCGTLEFPSQYVSDMYHTHKEDNRIDVVKLKMFDNNKAALDYANDLMSKRVCK